LAVTTATIVPQALAPLPAQASASDAVKEIQTYGEIGGFLWGLGGSSAFRQTFYGDVGFSSSLKRQYGKQADNVAANWCINKWNYDFLTPAGKGWAGAFNFSTNRWQFASREENGKYNCYIRLTNSSSDKFNSWFRR
jgi:hypothetical protein